MHAENLIEKYGLMPFKMQIQSIERTFIDKIFALCDYYMERKSNRLSRHLYDICKLYPLIKFDQSFTSLFKEVRNQRALMAVCPSAKPTIDIRTLIQEICDSDYYKVDYETITSYFTSDPVDYGKAKECLIEVIEKIPD